MSTYDDLEASKYGSTAFELYEFTMAPRNATPQTWRFTQGEIERAYNGYTYSPTVISRTRARQDRELQAGGTDITIALSNPVAQLFAPGIPMAPVAVAIYRGHDGDTEVRRKFIGQVYNSDFDEKCVLKCRPVTQAVKRKIPGMIIQRQCNHTVYSEGCGVPLSNWADGGDAHEFSVVITSISADRKTLAISGSGYDSYWSLWFGDTVYNRTMALGMALHPSGRSLLILGHPSASQIILKAPLNEAQVGDALKVYRGCDGSWKSCQGFYLWNVPESGNPWGDHGKGRFNGCDLMPSKNPFGGP